MMKNIKELGLELIELEDQVLLVEDKRPETSKIAVIIDKDSLFYGKYEIHKGTYERNFQWGTLIASTKPLEGLLLLVIEDEERVVELFDYIENLSKILYNPERHRDESIKSLISVACQSVYNKTKETYKFTEEDMVEFAMNMISQYQFGNTNVHNRGILMESLPKKELWVEVEYDHDDTVPYPKTKGTGHVLKITNNQIKAVWK